MKNPSILVTGDNRPVRRTRTAVRRLAVLAIAILAFLSLVPARAQNSDATPLGAAQLEQLIAPIALYPDSLLSQILMASTYPLEVVEAARWSSANPQVEGKALEDAVQQQRWDPSVKSLTTVPQTLQMMNDKLAWTQQLGDAFLSQQADVLSAVQRLRARADANGQLKTTEQQKVTKVASAPQGTSAITGTPAGPVAPTYVIEPANPEQLYVPIYDPGAVYGSWPYPDYAPYYWSPPGYVAAGVFGFAAAAVTGAAIWGGVDWGRNNVNVNITRFNQFNRTNIANGNWSHNPAHRGSVPYRDRNTAQRFGDPSKAAARDTFRGTAATGRQNLPADTKRSNADRAAGSAGNRAAGAKQTGSNKAANKQAGNKKAGNKQAGAKQSAQSKQAKSRQSAQSKGGAARQASRPAPSAQRAQAGGPRAGMGMSRPSNASMSRGGSFGGRGGMRGGGGRRR